MNSQCLEEAAQSNSCSPCAVPVPDPCPGRNSQPDPCPCQDVCPSCPRDSPQSSAGIVPPALPAEADPAKIPASGTEPFTIETPGMCVMKFPLQKSILTVELCPPDGPGMCPETSPLSQEELCVSKTTGISLENLSQELPIPAPEPCTLEVLELCPDEPCCIQGAIPGDPCSSQSGICPEPSGPCQSQGLGDAGACKDPKSQRFRLNSCTASIVERCLSRCQGWFRGNK